MKKTISAKVIADSKNTKGDRLTSFEITFPRMILAELNTHRMLSRNSASSRAVPFRRMIEMVQNDPFVPIRWMREHKGMQGTEYFDTPIQIQMLKDDWFEARNNAVDVACSLNASGVTKQVCNRLLEPFMWHTVIVSGTEWENFFALRAHEAAEIHMQELARVMLEAYNDSIPRLLRDGEWHIPYGDNMDPKAARLAYEMTCPKEYLEVMNESLRTSMAMVAVASARCARVSYSTHDGEIDYDKDIALHDRLSSIGHWSPFEHVAYAMNIDEYHQWARVESLLSNDGTRDEFLTETHHGWCGNFKGFIQYRKTFVGENKTDSRIDPK